MRHHLACAATLVGIGLLVAGCGPFGGESDTEPPSTPGIRGVTTSNSPQLSFTATDDETASLALRYQCSVDGGEYAPCPLGSPLELPPGPHTLRVIAVDEAGNESRPGTVSLMVTPTPDVTVVSFDGQFEPGDVTSGAGSVWLGGSNGIHRIDPVTNTMRLHSEGTNQYELAFGHGSVWATSFDDGKVFRVDAATGARRATISVPFALGVATDGTSVWATGRRDGSLVRIDPQSGAVSKVVKVTGEGPGGPGYVVVGKDGIWVGSSLTSPRLARVSAATNTVDLRADTGMCGGLALAGDVAIHTCPDASAVSLVDRSTGEARRVETPCRAERPIVVGSVAWVPCNGGGKPRLLRMGGTSTGEILEEVVIADVRELWGGTAAFGSAWFTAPGHGVVRIPLEALSR